jgi:predicted nuclease with TOPRIM domain
VDQDYIALRDKYERLREENETLSLNIAVLQLDLDHTKKNLLAVENENAMLRKELKELKK